MKIDKGALGKAIGIMLMSWAALPLVYYLIVRKKKEEIKMEEEPLIGEKGNQQKMRDEGVFKINEREM